VTVCLFAFEKRWDRLDELLAFCKISDFLQQTNLQKDDAGILRAMSRMLGRYMRAKDAVLTGSLLYHFGNGRDSISLKARGDGSHLKPLSNSSNLDSISAACIH